MRPSYVSRVQNVSPSGSGLTFDGKTRMFRRVFFIVFACFLGVCFWGLLCLLGLFGWFCRVVCCVLCVYFEKYRVFVNIVLLEIRIFTFVVDSVALFVVFLVCNLFQHQRRPASHHLSFLFLFPPSRHPFLRCPHNPCCPPTCFSSMLS